MLPQTQVITVSIFNGKELKASTCKQSFEKPWKPYVEWNKLLASRILKHIKFWKPSFQLYCKRCLLVRGTGWAGTHRRPTIGGGLVNSRKEYERKWVENVTAYKKFEMKDPCETQTCVCLEIHNICKNHKLGRFQTKYLFAKLMRFRMDACRSVVAPIEDCKDREIIAADRENIFRAVASFPYRELWQDLCT